MFAKRIQGKPGVNFSKVENDYYYLLLFALLLLIVPPGGDLGRKEEIFME